MNDSFVVIVIELVTGKIHAHAEWEVAMPGEDAVLYGLAASYIADAIARIGTASVSTTIKLMAA